jgi:hypothetical protein
MRKAASPVCSLKCTPSSVYASTPPPIITGVPCVRKCCASSRAWLGISEPLRRRGKAGGTVRQAGGGVCAGCQGRGGWVRPASCGHHCELTSTATGEQRAALSRRQHPLVDEEDLGGDAQVCVQDVHELGGADPGAAAHLRAGRQAAARDGRARSGARAGVQGQGRCRRATGRAECCAGALAGRRAGAQVQAPRRRPRQAPRPLTKEAGLSPSVTSCCCISRWLGTGLAVYFCARNQEHSVCSDLRREVVVCGGEWWRCVAVCGGVWWRVVVVCGGVWWRVVVNGAGGRRACVRALPARRAGPAWQQPSPLPPAPRPPPGLRRAAPRPPPAHL